VAQEAGVSIGTVSKALNGRGQLSAATRRRVLEAAARLEFRPNDLVRSLMRGRSFTVGLLTTDSYGRFSIPILQGIEDSLGPAQISVLLCDARDDVERERQYIDLLLAKQVDGVIVTARRIDPRPPVELGRARVPVVYAFTQVDEPDALCLLTDDAQGGYLATQHLLALGRRRLAHITGPGHFEAVRLRLEGLRRALAEQGLALAEDRVFSGPWQAAWGYEAAQRLLDGDPRIDGIFCGSDLIALGVVDGLRQRGRRVPDDVAVVGFDNWEIIATAARPSLTTVDMNLHELGRAAGARLLAMIEGRRETGTVLLPCSLVVRGSCGTQHTPEGKEVQG
jgi:LacI family transcriptional regulator